MNNSAAMVWIILQTLFAAALYAAETVPEDAALVSLSATPFLPGSGRWAGERLIHLLRRAVIKKEIPSE